MRARKHAKNQNIDLLKPGEPGEDVCEDILERRTTKKSKLKAVNCRGELVASRLLGAVEVPKNPATCLCPLEPKPPPLLDTTASILIPFALRGGRGGVRGRGGGG